MPIKPRDDHYTCNARVNGGSRCQCPSVRREELDEIVLPAIEDQLLARDRLRALLAGLLQLSDERRAEHEEELGRARAEQTRAKTAINQRLVLVEEGTIAVLENAIATTSPPGGPTVPSFHRKWCRLQDSNL